MKDMERRKILPLLEIELRVLGRAIRSQGASRCEKPASFSSDVAIGVSDSQPRKPSLLRNVTPQFLWNNLNNGNVDKTQSERYEYQESAWAGPLKITVRV
jgi:hypothetical protein